jgi:hypothetical protein
MHKPFPEQNTMDVLGRIHIHACDHRSISGITDCLPLTSTFIPPKVMATSLSALTKLAP